MMRRIALAGGMGLLLACTAGAATEITNHVSGPLGEFGAAAIRAAAASKPVGPVAIGLSKDLKPEAFRIRATGGGYAVTGGDARGAMYGALDLAAQLEAKGKAGNKQE